MIKLKRYISTIHNSSKQFKSEEDREEYINIATESHEAFRKSVSIKTYPLKAERSEKSFGYANLIMWTDICPFEIVKIVSPQTIEIRRMKSKLLNKEDLNFQVGGFSGHCLNNYSQKYDITSDENMPVIRARLRKDGYFHSISGRHSIDSAPSKHYDYNF